jgi:erythromycin esterase-like protein
MADRADADAIRTRARAWGTDHLVARAASARFVLLGEATHGTQEFYRERAEITKRLVLEHGLQGIAVEADWPDAYRVHRYVMGRSDDRDARASLEGFARFPQWMWRNEVIVELVEWLREHNAAVPEPQRTGFYGLDLYSLHASVEAIVRHLEPIDPEAAARARQRYACFDRFGRNTELYGYSTSLGISASCEDEAMQQLRELRERAVSLAKQDGRTTAEDAFFLEQNARLVKNAETYYRTMFRGAAESWNVRDAHMADTLDALAALLSQRTAAPRLVVWAHNSHLGDARATEMAAEGELNVGQLARQRHPEETFLVGFTTYDGTVTAASDWDAPAEQKTVLPAFAGSYEALFHATEEPRLVVFPAERGLELLRQKRPERAIGVVYRPQTERRSHWFEADLAAQFDAVVHIDTTSALVPLERVAAAPSREAPETFPSAL